MPTFCIQHVGDLCEKIGVPAGRCGVIWVPAGGVGVWCAHLVPEPPLVFA